MYFDDLTEEELLKENMIADSIKQQREFIEMQTMYEENQLEEK